MLAKQENIQRYFSPRSSGKAQGKLELGIHSLYLSSQQDRDVKKYLRMIDRKDPYTYGHCLRVTQVALLIAQSIGLCEEDLQQLYIASCLHDIGKIGVPDSILHKTERLSKEEMAFMQKHSEMGYSLLCKYGFPHDVAIIVQSHHERWDGLGYPHGLVGSNIVLAARILAVADAYDAITSDRPYRKGQSHDYGVHEIKNHSGDQFDPFCVIHFAMIEEQIPRLYTTVKATQDTCKNVEHHGDVMHSKRLVLKEH